MVRLPSGEPIPGVSVVVRDEATKREVTALTDVNGAFTFAFLSDGLYCVEVTFEGFRPARIQHLQLKAGEVTHARVALRLEAVQDEIIVGAIAVDPMHDGISTTFTQDFINKLPM